MPETPDDLGHQLMKELKRWGMNYDEEKALALIERGANPNFNCLPTLLNIACGKGSIRVVEALLNKGAAIDRNTLGWTVHKNGEDIAQLLLNRGADPLVTDVNGRKASLIAQQEKWNALYAILLEAERATQARREEQQRAAEQRQRDIENMLDTHLAAAKVFAALPAWSRPTPERVMHVERIPGLDSDLVDIFNFATRERIVVTKDMKSGAEFPSAPVSFDAVNRDVLQKAFCAFTTLGGSADAERVFRKKLNKPQLAFKAGE